MSSRGLQLLLTAWAGSLWTLCGIVTPSLFTLLPDRHVAGELAGYFFRVAAWLGFALGAVVLALLIRRKANNASPGITINVSLTITALVAPVLSEVVLRPLMTAAQSAGDMARFGMLHGVAALLFAVACIATALLVWRMAPQDAISAQASGSTIRG